MSRGICHPGYCYHRNSPFFSSQMIAMTTSNSINVKPLRMTDHGLLSGLLDAQRGVLSNAFLIPIPQPRRGLLPRIVLFSC